MAYGFQTVEGAIDAALYLENNQVMQLVVFFRLMTSLLAWIVMTSVYKSIHKMRAHKGLVLLLRIHYFWTHCLCSCAIFDTAMIIYKSTTWENPEDLLNNGFLCFIRKVPYSVAICGGSISLLIIVIERRQASVYVRTYESAGIRLALKLSIFEVLYLICFFAGASTMFDFNLNFAHCTAVTASSEKFMSVAALTVLIVQMAALIVFRKLLRRNMKFLERDNESLSERYQIKENIRTLNLLVPLVETQFILTFTPIGMWLLYATIPHGLDPRAYPVFEESINVIQLYGIVMPITV